MNKCEKLLALLTELPPDLKNIENFIKLNEFANQELATVVCKFGEHCFLDYRDYREYHGKEATFGELNSDYLYEICKLFIKNGMDVNTVVTDEYSSRTNLLEKVRWVYNPRTSAKTFKLLLEKGGDINVNLDVDKFFCETDFDFIFDLNENMTEFTDILFEIWIMMVGYGGKLSNGKTPVILNDGYSIEDLKNYENFAYEKYHTEDDWHLNIIDKRNNKIAGKMRD